MIPCAKSEVDFLESKAIVVYFFAMVTLRNGRARIMHSQSTLECFESKAAAQSSRVIKFGECF